ncbi:MAG: hypothetical protein GYA58_10345 [Anaerolineaceae bacterium]|nr:hypothetical protein [Anaerolineaceae bacterium]
MNSSLDVLLYIHPDQEENAQRVLSALQKVDDIQIHTILSQNGGELDSVDWDAIDLFVLFFSDHFSKDEVLFQVVQRIKKREHLERIFFLPANYQNSENHFPAVLHLLRFQQHHLFFYASQSLIETQINEAVAIARESWEEKQKRVGSQSGKPSEKWLARLWRKTAIRTGVYLLPVFALLIVIFIQLLPQTLTALAAKDSFRELVPAPAMKTLWVEDKFTSIDSSFWAESHKFRGAYFVDTNTDKQYLAVHTDKPVLEDQYQLQSVNSWPIEDLEALQISLKLDPVESSDTTAALAVRIINTKEDQYFVECQVLASQEAGTMQCSIDDKNQKAMLANAIPFSYGDWHVLTMAFVPSRYSFQFFLDGKFYGEVQIPAVVYWRGRNFAVRLGTELQGLSSGQFSAYFDEFELSYQYQRDHEE